MKKLLILFISGLMVMTSCKDDEKQPIITFDQAGKGAYPKLIELKQGEYDLKDIPGSKFAYEIEFVDLEQGDLVSSYNVLVTYIDNNPGNGDATTSQQLYNSFDASEFFENDRGFKGLDVELPLTAVASSIGVNTADLIAGDVFAFSTEVILADGSKFTGANSSAAVRGSAFAGFFDFNANATCPMPDSQFSGNYTLSYEDVSGGWGESIVEGTVTLETVPGSTTQRRFACVFLDIFGGFNITVTIDFVCDKVQFFDNDTGVGCGNNILLLGSFGGEDYAQPADINDDSVIRLVYAEIGGDCGYDALRTMVLTKQ